MTDKEEIRRKMHELLRTKQPTEPLDDGFQWEKIQNCWMITHFHSGLAAHFGGGLLRRPK